MIEDAIRDESPSWVNAKIDRETLAVLDEYRDASPEAIAERIDELGWEYDVACATSIVCGVVGLGGVLLSRYDRRFLIAAGIANGLLLFQNLPITSPFTSVFRVFGFRSRTEIERERHALKMMRGDYRRAENDPTPKGAMTSAQSERGMVEGSGGSRVTGDPRGLSSMSRDSTAGEDMRPMDAPTVSGPSGDITRH